MQLVVYPLLQVLLYLALLFSPRDANHVTITGPGLAYEMDTAQGGWTAWGPEFPDSAKVALDGDTLITTANADHGHSHTHEVGSYVRSILENQDRAGNARWELDADHVVEKTHDGFRFLVNPGRSDAQVYRVVYQTLSAGNRRAPPPSQQLAAAPQLRANVLGAVARPGSYSLTVGATATEALAAAGDVHPRADLPGSIILRGAAGDLPQVIPFNPGVIRRGEALDVPLQDRDTLYVPPLRKPIQQQHPAEVIRSGIMQPAPFPSHLAVRPPPAQSPQTHKFGGVEWAAWRTLFEVRPNEGLVSLPTVRPGFDYGHGGHGRGPEVVTHIGDPDWRDYRVDADLLVPGVDPALNPHGLGLDFHGAMIAFHVADRKESFNDCGTSAYIVGFEGPGNWGLMAYRNHYCRQAQGFGNPGGDYERRLAGGSHVALDPVKGNRFRIEVRGQRIQIWIDGEQIVDVVDEDMGKVIGGQSLDHGGVAFCGGFDAMIRLRSFEITHLAKTSAPKRRPR